MVNASLNWASIVGIVLAVCGGGLYFLRSFKPALARDYDVFFAAIGLLCGGILFFQGWRLDPILQFGQFLLVGHIIVLQIALILSEQRKSRKELSLLSESKTVDPIKGATSKKDSFGDIETYLETLQKWKSKKLITEEEFQAKKKKVLDL